jgi:hypothetical protein
MTFPVIREILCTLAEFDLLAALALTETSATFHDFIFGQVVTAKVVLRLPSTESVHFTSRHL